MLHAAAQHRPTGPGAWPPAHGGKGTVPVRPLGKDPRPYRGSLSCKAEAPLAAMASPTSHHWMPVLPSLGLGGKGHCLPGDPSLKCQNHRPQVGGPYVLQSSPGGTELTWTALIAQRGGGAASQPLVWGLLHTPFHRRETETPQRVCQCGHAQSCPTLCVDL